MTRITDTSADPGTGHAHNHHLPRYTTRHPTMSTQVSQ